MDQALEQQVLDELFEHIEDVETQSAAVLHFLKAKGIATDEEMAPYFEQASKATSVKWVAERARINRLLSAAAKPPEKAADPAPSKPGEKDSAQPEEKEPRKAAEPEEEKPEKSAEASSNPTPVNL